MAAEKLMRIASKAGIKRDGTMLEGDYYVDGQWVRFQRGLPRKIGGYRRVNNYLHGPVRALHEHTQNSLTYIHAGSADRIERLYIQDFNTSPIVDRTPTTGFTVNDNNLWQFDAAVRLNGGVRTNMLIAQVAPNLADIANDEGGDLFYGDLTGSAPLTPIALPTGGNATGGVVSLYPYLFFFGNDGYIGWSVAGDPTDLSGVGSGAINAGSQKIVRGMQLRGGPGNSPSGLFWATNALIRASFVGGDAVFQFDTISTETSILSARSVIEYDGIFYWIGVDRFLSFNGVVREIKNDLNQNFFFDELNYEHRQKVFAFKVPRFGEIWWCYPRGASSEPNHAIIYNVREDTWYDTALPEDNRSAGIFPTVYRKPLMTSAVPYFREVDYRLTEGGDVRATEDDIERVTEDSELPTYRLWAHEVGVDAIEGQSAQPIKSYFETAEISLQSLSGETNALQVLMLEPDFVQSGDMTVQIRGRRNARSEEMEGPRMTFPDTARTPTEQVVYFKEQRRQLRFYFESNALGGDYQMGAVFAHIKPGDGTTRS